MAAKKKKSPAKKVRHFKTAKKVSKSQVKKNNSTGIFSPTKFSRIYLAKLHDLTKYVKILISKFKLKGIIK